MNCPYVMRMCSKCGEVKFLFKFNKGKRNKYGFKKECKECESEYHKQRYKNHKEEILENNKQWYQNHKEERSEYQKQHYQDNKEEILENQKQYSQTPQGRVVALNKGNRRRSKLENQGRRITTEQWLEMMNFFGWKCAYSDMSLSEKNRSTDHIVALANGGLNEIWNCVPMYKPYNSSKCALDMLEWYKQQDFYSEERLQKINEWQEYAYNKWCK